jgi:hypothetical protein
MDALDEGADAAVDEIAVDAAVEDDSPTDPPEETTEPLTEVEQIAELRETLAGLEARPTFDPKQLSTVTGRVGALQSKFDTFDAAPVGDMTTLQEQVKGQATLIGALTGALANSDLLDDASRASLQALVDENTQTANATALREEATRIVDERLAKSSPPADPANAAPGVPSEWQNATNEVEKYAKARDFDPTQIPHDTWNPPTGHASAAAAQAVLFRYIDAQVDGSARRTATRKVAAGKASPPASGGSLSDERIVEEWGADLTSHDMDKEVLPAMKRLGMRP